MPMQLDEYIFPEISVKANWDFNPEEPIDFSCLQLSFFPSKGKEKSDEYVLQMHLVTSKSDAPNVPYFVDIVGIINFFYPTETEIEDKDAKAFHNGASMLYSAMREQIAILSSRSIYKTMYLPAWYFKLEQFKNVEQAKS